MKEFRIRPKNDFLHTANWEEIYSLTEHWLDDLEFYNEEISFLDTLIRKYFILMTKKESLETIQKVSASVSNLNKKQKLLFIKVKQHLNDFGILMEDVLSNTEEWFRVEHIKLEEGLVDLTKQFKQLKKEVFQLVEHIIESQKLQHLLVSKQQ